MKPKLFLIPILVPLLLICGGRVALSGTSTVAELAPAAVADAVVSLKPAFSTAPMLAGQLAVTTPITGLAWLRQWGSNRSDISAGVAVDTDGNIYVAGNTNGDLGGPSTGETDAWVAKYDSVGNQLWLRQWGTAGDDSAWYLTVDSDGSVYVAGDTDENEGDIWLVKYDGAGNQAWLRQWGTDEWDGLGWGMGVDADGNVYLTGSTNGDLGGSNAGPGDAWVAKYDSAGVQQWLRQFGTDRNDEAEGIVVAANGAIYLAGRTNGSLGGQNSGWRDAWLARFDSAGNRQWLRQWGPATFDSLAVDADGNVYVTGETFVDLGGPNAGEGDIWLVKYDGVGNQQWLRQWGSDKNDNDRVIAVDGSGNVLVGGETYGAVGVLNAGESDVWLVKYDSTGVQQWLRQWGSSQRESLNWLVVDVSDNVYVTGETYGDLGGPNAGGGDAWLAMYDSTGSQQWLQQWGTATGDLGLALAADARANVYLTGWTHGDLQGSNAGGVDVFLAKFNPPRKVPLVFVPGMAGSYLVDLNPGLFLPEERWPGIGSLSTLHNTLSLYPEDNPSPDIIATDAIRQVCPLLAGCKIYGPMLEALVQRGGYRELPLPTPQDYRSQEWTDEQRRQGIAGLAEAGWCTPVAGQEPPTLFVFSYDWRKSNIANAGLLKKYIEHCVRAYYPNDDVAILAHSNGGLLARRYILDNPDQHHVDKLITYGSPWLGAPKMLYVLESGEMGLPPFVLRSTIKYIAGSFSGAHELLPSQAYQELGGAPVVVEEGWDWNENGEWFEEIDSYFHLAAAIDERYGGQGFEPGVANALFHLAEQDDWRLDASGVEYFHLYGRQFDNRSIAQLRARPFLACANLQECVSTNILQPGFATRSGVGDGTVPRLSAARIGMDELNTDYNAANTRLFPFCSVRPADDDLVEHNGLNRNPQVQDQILELLGVTPISPDTTVAALRLQEQLASDLPDVTNEVLEALAQAGKAQVVISLYDSAPVGASSAEMAASVAQVQQAVLAKLSPTDFVVAYQYSHIAALAGEITQQGLEILRQHPLVRHIHLNEPLALALDESVPAIGADVVQRDYHLTGKGVRVAVLDTGVKKDHPDLQGAVVREKCFTLVGDCPGGGAESDSADDPDGHGTLVASIIASRGRVGGRGVAPQAEIVAMRLGEVLPGDARPTFNYYDVLGGLNWIIREQSELQVQIINMSMGSKNLFEGACDDAKPEFTEAVNKLTAMNILIFASTGNASSMNGIGFPACVSGVIGVGASNITNNRQTSIANLTNRGVRMDLVAPGVDITGAALNGGTRTASGTSFAAPHAAGVAALMLQDNQCANVGPVDIEWLLMNTGDTLVDTDGEKYPAINALKAIKRISNSATHSEDQRNDYLVDLPDYFVTIIGGRSPVVLDQLGNSTAPISDSLQLSVPGVDTYTLGDAAHMAIVPATGIHSITFQTIGKPAVIEITAGTGDHIARAIRYQDLSMAEGGHALLVLSGANVSALRYDADGDGVFETTVNPTVDVIGADALDVQPPTITVSSTQYSAATLVTLTATDSGSGMNGLYYSLNGIQFQPYAQPISLSPGQASTIYAFADDKAANRGTRLLEFAGSQVNMSVYLPIVVK